MPITCYTGLQRHGKTYQVVSHVIPTAMRQGRRVVTNIAGVNESAIREYLISDGCDPDSIGEVVCIDHEEVKKDHFFRTDTVAALGVETFVQPGDLVALDEVWRFWPKRGRIPERHNNFFRTHGQMPDPKTGLICEIALITQSIRDINENIRDVVFETYRMTKDTAIGSEKTYSVVIYARASESSRDEIRRFKGRYEERFFPFYKSHSQAQEGTVVKEEGVDNRGNILKGALFKYALPLMLIIGGGSAYQLYRFFHVAEPKKETAAATATATATARTASGDGVRPKPEVSQQWRLVGWYKRGLETAAILQSAGGVRVVRGVDKWVLYSYGVEGEVDGERVAGWSGGAADRGAGDVKGITAAFPGESKK